MREFTGVSRGGRHGDHDRLAGRRALVTGGGSGIGRAVAFRLAAEGAAVGVVDVRDGAAEAVATAISQDGGKASPRPATWGARPRSRSRRRSWWGARRAGHRRRLRRHRLPGVTHETPLEAWETMLRVNPHRRLPHREARSPHLIEAGGGGAIVTIGSVAALVAAGQSSAYDASKAGVLEFTRAVAVEYVDDGIRANCVCPGLIATDLGAEHPGHHRPDRRVRPAPAGDRPRRRPDARVGPSEIAAAVAFLCSDDASFITGIALPVDGGFTAI